MDLVCNLCDIPLQVPVFDPQSERVKPSYGWQRVGIVDGRPDIGRAKKERGNSYGRRQ